VTGNEHLLREELFICAPGARENLSSLGLKTAAGESFLITKRGQPVAKLVPAFAKRSRLFPGCAPEVVMQIAEDFDGPLDDMRPYME
jgi:antitoxin (DNA-binding transcriptional repressor) of toxin-antitoxin stability system